MAAPAEAATQFAGILTPGGRSGFEKSVKKMPFVVNLLIVVRGPFHFATGSSRTTLSGLFRTT
jgi:hypothetical protein